MVTTILRKLIRKRRCRVLVTNRVNAFGTYVYFNKPKGNIITHMHGHFMPVRIFSEMEMAHLVRTNIKQRIEEIYIVYEKHNYTIHIRI